MFTTSSNRDRLLSKESRRLIEEFALFYRFLPATVHVTIVRCIAIMFENDSLRPDDSSLLEEIKIQVRIAMTMQNLISDHPSV